jgi:magnesium-transporting ATPase (P-type)
VSSARPPHWTARLIRTARDPFAVVLCCLAAISAAIGDVHSTAVIGLLVLVSCLLRFRQEQRSGQAASALAAVVAAAATAAVTRPRPR